MKIGILGASGVVGRQMLECLEERKIIPEELRLFGYSSVGQKISFNNKEYIVEKPDFTGLDVVFGAVGATEAKSYIEDIRKAGALFIDNSSAFRYEDDVPLVIPEINGEDVYKHHGIIANPNCSTIIALMAIKAINELSPIKSMIASTYQAVSGAGIKGFKELDLETREYARDEEIINHGGFEHQIVFNVLAKIGNYTDDEYTKEEMKMELEGRKIMHLPELNVTCTCVRVPVLRSHSISISLNTKDHLELAAVKEALKHSEGVRYLELPDYPMPLETSGQDIVHVGRVRKDRVFENGIALFCCGDQVRKGAASNAVQILEYYLKHQK
ncbi:MAG: aspartate-semialdehyde dehydrogenase [Erysipelotrichaceae bacterium]|nr:aspartate-semialdehyde dehydrogenase [Erysipelotrichaceae bacterium]